MNAAEIPSVETCVLAIAMEKLLESGFFIFKINKYKWTVGTLGNGINILIHLMIISEGMRKENKPTTVSGGKENKE